MEGRFAHLPAFDDPVAAERHPALIVAGAIGTADGACGAVAAGRSVGGAASATRAGEAVVTLLGWLHDGVTADAGGRAVGLRNDGEPRIFEEEVEHRRDVVRGTAHITDRVLRAIGIGAVNEAVGVIVDAVVAELLEVTGARAPVATARVPVIALFSSLDGTVPTARHVGFVVIERIVREEVQRIAVGVAAGVDGIGEAVPVVIEAVLALGCGVALEVIRCVAAAGIGEVG